MGKQLLHPGVKRDGRKKRKGFELIGCIEHAGADFIGQKIAARFVLEAFIQLRDFHQHAQRGTPTDVVFFEDNQVEILDLISKY